MWALVTGGSSGLGCEMAKRLAKDGYDLVIVARNEQRLDGVAASIREKYAVEVRTVSLDLSQEGAAEWLYHRTCDMGIHPDVLVNDAGMYLYGHIADIAPEKQEEIINFNVRTLAAMCRIYGADMAERASRKDPKYILNIASYSIYMPIEGLGLYAGTKAFNRIFSISYAKEMRPSHVYVTAVSPAGIDTDLMNLRPSIRRLGKMTGFLVNPSIIAAISLRVMKIPCIRHWIPLAANVIFIPFLWMFQPLFRRVL